MASFAIWVLDAATYALTLALVVMGLGIVFGLLGVINLAHGEFFTLGAFGLLLGQEHGAGFWGGLVIGVALAAIVGLLTQLILVRRLYDHLLMTLLATYGLSLVIRQSLQWIFGPQGHVVTAPIGGSVHFGSETYPWYRFFIMGSSLACVIALAWFFSKTRSGVTARAVVENRSMAQVMGIHVDRIYVAMFVIGTALAGLAGAIMAPVLSVTPDVGKQYLIFSFLIVIFVGLERLRRNLFIVLFGAALIGSLSNVLAREFSGLTAEAAVTGLVVLVLMIRPQGLFRG